MPLAPLRPGSLVPCGKREREMIMLPMPLAPRLIMELELLPKEQTKMLPVLCPMPLAPVKGSSKSKHPSAKR
eukprot:11233599-Prorocentrum_lima.AAC.1